MIYLNVINELVSLLQRRPRYSPREHRCVDSTSLENADAVAQSRTEPRRRTRCWTYVLAFALVCSALLLQSESQAARRPTLWILAIGISDYADPELSLRFADSDARAMVEAFEQGGSGPLFREVRVQALLNADATRGSILQHLERFLGRAAPTDLAIVYLAGHGIYEPATDGYYFLPSTATRDNLLIEGLDMIEFNRQVQRLHRNIGAVIVVLDTCYAGAATEGTRDVRFGGDLASRLAPAGGLYILAGAKSGEQSQESDTLGHGAFTKALLDGIRGAAAESDGYVTVLGLASYAARVVPELTDGRQHPYYKITGGNPVLAIDPTRASTTIPPTIGPIAQVTLRNEKQRIAVMSFKDLRADPEHEWMEEGLREEFTTVMNIVTRLEVYAEPEVQLMAQSATEPMAAARQAGMDMVVSGTFAVQQERISIRAHVKDVSTMKYLASAKVDGPLDSFFELRNRIVIDLLDSLRFELPEPEVAQILQPTGENLDIRKLLFKAEGVHSDQPTEPESNPEPLGQRRSIWDLISLPKALHAQEDEESRLVAILEGYRSAFERKDLKALSGYYADFGPEQRDAMQQYLSIADDLSVRFDDIRVTIAGKRAAVSFTRSDEFVDVESGERQEVKVRLTKTFAKTDSGWQITPADWE